MTIYIKRKRCSKCGELKALGAFTRNAGRPDGRASECKVCRHDYRVEHRDQIREYGQGYDKLYYEQQYRDIRTAHSRELRDLVLDYYGGECACCRAADDLTIDHIDGMGCEHRDELFGHRLSGGNSSTEFYRWLIENDFPEGYQTLCRPCNASKGKGTHCRLGHIPGRTQQHRGRGSNVPVTKTPAVAN